MRIIHIDSVTYSRWEVERLVAAAVAAETERCAAICERKAVELGGYGQWLSEYGRGKHDAHIADAAEIRRGAP